MTVDPACRPHAGDIQSADRERGGRRAGLHRSVAGSQRRLTQCQDCSGRMGSVASPTSISSRPSPSTSAEPPPATSGRTGERWSSARTPAGPGDMFVAAIAAGATSLGIDVHAVGVVPTPALAFLAGRGTFIGGIMVSASHNPADDNGLKVLDGHGLKLDDAVEDELEQLIWRADELGGVGNAGLGPGHRCARPRRGVPRAPDGDGARHPGDRAAGRPRRGERLGLDARAARSSRRPARRSRSSTPTRTGSTSTSAAAPRTRPRWPRPSSVTAPTSASPSTATRTGSSRSMPTGQRRRRRPGPRDPGARPAGPRRAARWRARRLGPLERRPAVRRRGRRRPGRPDPGRRQVHPRGDAGVRRDPRRREERPRHHPRAHDLGRRDRDRARGPAGHVRPRRVAGRPRLGHPAAAAATARRARRVTRTNGRATGSWARRSRPATRPARIRGPHPRPAVRHGTRPAGHGRGRGRTHWCWNWPTRSRLWPGSD